MPQMLKAELLQFRKVKGYLPPTLLIHIDPSLESEIEKEVAEAYDKAAKEVADPSLKQLLLRIRDNEMYHIEVFNDLLMEEEDK